MRRKNPYRPLPPASTGELNMTPLIDVLLVLLVMILLTMPLTTHSLEVPLPCR